MPLIEIQEKSGLIPIEEKRSPEPILEDDTVSLKTFQAGEGEFMLSTPEQRYEWSKQGTEGWWEYAAKTKGSDIYYGQVAGSGSLWGLVNRLRDDDYEDKGSKENDMEVLRDVMLRQEEVRVRGSTWGKNVYRIVANIPTFAMEMALTGGLATAIRTGIQKAGVKVAGEVAKKSLLRKGVEVLGREAVVGLARTTVLPHRYVSNYAQKSLNEHLAITDKGIQLIEDSAETPVVAFMKAYGDTFVEFYSETMGGQLFKPIGKVATRGMLNRMPEATKEVFSKIAEGIAKKIPKGRIFELMSKGGWDGLIEEYGEERFGALLRAVTGLDEREISMLDKLQEAVFPGWDQASVELGAFAMYGGMGASSQVLNNHLRGKRRSQEDIDKIINNLSENEKDQMSVKLGQTFEAGKLRAEVVVKAASGQDLSIDELTELNRVYQEFVDKGLIEPIKVAPEPIPKGKEGIIEPLIEEAKKYKTAEEFVASQEKFYHGTPSKFKEFLTPKEMPEELAQEVLGTPSETFGIYFTTSKELASEFGKNIIETSLNITKPLDLTNIKSFDDLVNMLPIDKKVNKWELGNMVRNSYYDEYKPTDSFYKPLEDLISRFKLLPKLKKMGYDAIVFNDVENAIKGVTTIVLDKSQIKTKQQLTDIWKQAQLKPEITPEQKKAQQIVEANVKEVQKPKVTPKTIKKDVSGKTILIKQIEDMEDREKRIFVAEFALEDIETKREQFKGRIKKYKDEFLKEELTGIPKYYISTDPKAITPDEVLEELREQGVELTDEVALKEYLQNLESTRKELKETIQENKAQLVTKKETTILKQRIKDIDRGIRAGKFVQKKEVKSIQTELINLLKASGLDAKDKAKFIKAIKNIQTADQLSKALPVIEERIERLEEAAEKRGLVKKILKQPKKPENIIDVTYQKKINDILNKLGDKKQVRKKALNAMSVNELVELADTLAELKETGKKVFTTKKEQRKVASEILRAALIKQAGGTKAGMFSKGSLEERRAKRSPLLKVADIITLRPLRMIRRLFGDIGEDLIYDSIDNADMQRGVYSWLRKKKIEQAMEDNKVTFFNLGRLIEIDGKSYQVNNILRMYLATKDKKSYDALKFGNNLTDVEITAFIDSVKADYPDYIKFADEVQKIVSERTDEYAQTVETYFNVEMERVEVYFPIKRIGKGGISQEELNLDIETEMINEQIIRKGAGFTYTSADKKNTYSRKELDEKYQSEISLDFMGDAIKIIESQEHLIAYAPLQKAFNKILDDPDLQDAVKYNHGQASWKWLNDYLDVNVNPAKMFQGANWIERYVNRVIKPVRLGLSKAYLGFNVVTAGKQFPSLALALKYTTPQDMAISMERMLFKENRDKIYELDPSLKNRVVSRDFKDLLKTIEALPESDIKRALLVASKAIDKKAFAMIMQMDKYAVLSVYDAVYRHQSKTKSIVEAKNIAHKAVIETQPQGGVKDLPALYRTNSEFLRLGLMFTNQLNQIWNMTRADLPREISKGQYARATMGIASIIVSSTLIYIMSHGRLPQDPDDFFDAIFGSTIASIPIIGNMSMAYLRGYEPSISPASSIMNNLKFMKSNIENEEYMKAMEKASFILAVWLQMPYAQPRRTIKGILDLMSGEAESFRRLLWSEFMLENN